MKMLPDCKVFAFEVISTNMLMADVYAPKGRIAFESAVFEEVE